MRTRISAVAAVGMLAVVFAAGCGWFGGKPAAVPDSSSNADGSAAAQEEGPDEAVRKLAKGLEENRPQVLWESLPPSYRADVNSVVRGFAKRMDPEIWSRSVAIVRRSAALLKSHREFLLQHPALQNNPALPAEGLAESWNGIAGLIESLAASDAARLDQLEEFDGGRFLAGTGVDLLRQVSELSEQTGDDSLPAKLRRQFQALKVTIVRHDGDTAVLRIDAGDPAVPPQEREYVRKDGKWIPRALADGWSDGIESVRARLDSFASADALTKSRQSTLASLAQAEEALDELEAAEDAEAFLAAFNAKVVVPITLAAASRRHAESGVAPAKSSPDETPAAPVATNPGEDPRVTVLVKAALNEAARDSWQDKLARVTDRPEIGLAIPTGDGNATRFEVTPVADVERFAKRIDFATVKSVDPATRTVTLEP